MKQRINIITLGVSNLDKTLKFYEDGLKWIKSNTSQENIAFFQMGGVVLAFYLRDSLAEDANIPANGNGFSGITIAYNVKSELEVDEVLKEVEILGAKIVKPAQKVFWGGYSGYFKDLDGHIFEVAFNPFFKFDKNDNLIM